LRRRKAADKKKAAEKRKVMLELREAVKTASVAAMASETVDLLLNNHYIK
jgi:hypothetical protein